MDDEYDEYDFSYGYGQDAALQMTGVHQATAAAAANQLHMTQANEKEEEEQQEQEHEQHEAEQTSELKLCYAADCQQNCYGKQQIKEDGNTNESQSVAELETKSEHCLAIDFDLINATGMQVLQNCATFNGLSLLDAAGEQQQVEPFT